MGHRETAVAPLREEELALILALTCAQTFADDTEPGAWYGRSALFSVVLQRRPQQMLQYRDPTFRRGNSSGNADCSRYDNCRKCCLRTTSGGAASSSDLVSPHRSPQTPCDYSSSPTFPRWFVDLRRPSLFFPRCPSSPLARLLA